jgi:FAD-dependent oxidoreductase domain-containing protein 1
MGASTAYHLAKQRLSSSSSPFPQQHNDDIDHPSILIVEQDLSLKCCSAIYSAGGVRLQFSLKENVLMSLYCIDFLRQCRNLLATTTTSQSGSSGTQAEATATVVDVQFVENGYLILASTDLGAKQLRENYSMYQNIGCDDRIALLSPDALKSKFPWMNTHDVVLGSLGLSDEGWFDPWSFLTGLHAKNKELGVKYLSGTVIGGTRCHQSQGQRLSSIRVRTKSNEIRDISVKTVVNAAGAKAGQVLDLLAGGDKSFPLLHPLPVRPRKRCIYFFQCDYNQQPKGVIVPSVTPLTIDSSGAYFRSEGTTAGTGRFLCGIPPPSSEDLDCFDSADLQNADPILFERDIWPAISNRVPAFNSLKVISSWAGLYEMNIVDHNCILDFHPELLNVLMVNGFSGHGLQHSPAAGRAAAELIDNNNRFSTLDLNIFRFDRLMEGGVPVLEKGIY